MLKTMSPRVEESQVASSLVAFMGELTAPLLTERDRYELLLLFSLLSGLSLARPQAAHRRAALCSDGTPLELSLSIDDQGRHSLRFVCDVAAGMPKTARSQHQWFRDLAGKVVPQFDGSCATLDRLFEMHLRGAREASRFRVWFGAGATPGSPRISMLYFNAEWLSPADVLDILAPHLRPEDSRTLGAWQATCEAGYAGIAYDFDATGFRKVKLYIRPDVVGVRKLKTLLQRFPGQAGEKLHGLFEKGFAASRGRRGNFILALGLPVQSAAIEATAYLHLESWGVRNFVVLSPILRRLLGSWGFDLDKSLSAGPHGCAPTLLSLSVSEQRQRLALYFKPLLNERQVEFYEGYQS